VKRAMLQTNRKRRLAPAPLNSAPVRGGKNFPVLSGIETLTVFVDRAPQDANGRRAGQEATLACSTRWTAAGLECRRRLPRRLGGDMADIVDGTSGGQP
jgi:hypothetical protein